MKRLILLSLAAMMVASCSRFTLSNSKVLNGHDMSQYKTYNIQPLQEDKLPEGVSYSDVKALYDIVGNQLSIRGYQKVDGGAADITLYLSMKLHKSIEKSTNTTGSAYGVGYGRGGWGGMRNFGDPNFNHAIYGSSSLSTTEMVIDGILMMDLVEGATQSHAFCSQISTRLENKGDILKDNEQMEAAAEKLFKKFPVKPLK